MAKDITKILIEYGTQFPPLIGVGQAADIAHVPMGTIYDWSARGVLDHLKVKKGKHVLFMRDKFVEFLCAPPTGNEGD